MTSTKGRPASLRTLVWDCATSSPYAEDVRGVTAEKAEKLWERGWKAYARLRPPGRPSGSE